ncbi:MAG: glycosyltransferase family 39 protein, partial [Candidatus Aminicenantaceae bacterium]
MKQKNKKIPWQVIACALFVFIFTNLFSYFIFNHIPRVHDEIDYLFQAKIFKSGRLYVPSPCAKESFDFPHMVNNGKWYSQYTPGYPFLLLLGLLIQAPWLINPILASLSIILFYLLGKEIYNSKVGILAAFMGTISIWFLLMSSTMMSHTSGLFFITFFLYFLFRSIKNPSITNGLLTGMGLGMAFLIRPYNAILISTPFLIYYVVLLIKNIRKRLKNIITFGLAVIFFLSILLIYNQITNGHPLKMGYFASYGVEHSLGFSR